MTSEKINFVEIEKDDQGNYKYIHVMFGATYWVEIGYDKDGELNLIIGQTHHGFKARATQKNHKPTELQTFIDVIRTSHPESVVDEHGTLNR